MKKIFLLLSLFLSMAISSLYAASPKEEFRASWLATVWSIDWPKTSATTTANRTAQQKELTDIFDKMKAGNMNAVCLQVRGRCDAFYKSSYEPWAAELAGSRGKDPGYDPLAFAIEEAHKRGMELHVWVNPFRVTSSGTISTSDKVWQNAGQWIIKYNNGSFSGQIIDPGYPEAREYVLDVLMEIVENYDVDGILMDDYFYPYGGTTTEDAKSKSLHKPSSGIVDQDKDGSTDDDWRRSNVDDMMKKLYDRIQVTKPWVRFGMGTFGIWTMKSTVANAYGISLPSGITGLDDYEEQACNPVEWVKGGYVDYINPQLYWPTTSTGQSYEKLVKWWGQDVCQHFSELLPGKQKVHFFSSQSCSSNTASSEIIKQIDLNRKYLSSGYTGSVFYNTTAYLKMYSALTSRFDYKALPPAMDWKSTTTLGAPENLTLSGTTLMWSHPSATRFTVYVYPKSTTLETAQTNPAYLKGIVYGNSYSVSGIDLNNYNVAVFSYDRFGVEHAAAVYGEGSTDPGTNPNPDTGKITWELNGGEVKSVTVPGQEDLWYSFKSAAGLTSILGLLSDISANSNPCKEICTYLTSTEVQKVFANSEWTWLKEYIMSTQNAQAGQVVASNTVPELTTDLTTATWRYAIATFFLQTQYTAWPYTADFSTAGQPSVWGVAYQTAHGGASLPTYVTSTFTLPTPTHPQGYAFLGWYDNPEFTGTPLTTIPAGWTGTLYAKWAEANTEHPQVIFWFLNGGTVNVELPKYVTENYTLPIPTRDGYVFAGWYSNSNFTSAEITLITAGWEGSLYAKWIEETPEEVIYWVLNGGTVSGILPSFVTSTYLLPTPTRDGYIFAGWYDNPEFTGNPITEIPAGWQGTLYAKWETGVDEPETTTIKWELNGGQENPYNWSSKQDMWLDFQDDYREFYGVEIRNYAIDSCAKWTYDACGDGKAITEMLTYEEKWIWLREYMEKVAYNANFNNGQLGTAVLLRFSLHAFLNNSPANDNTYSGNPDYTLNGQLSYWYLDWGYTWKGHLPTTLTSTYVLPKPYKDGRTFLGWSTDPEGVGYIYELPAGFIGTVYAIWDVMDDVTTSMEEIEASQQGQMYDLLGRPVNENYKGIVIIKGQKYLLK